MRKLVPFVYGVMISHRRIAARTYGSQIVYIQRPALGFWNIVTDFKIKDRNLVGTPVNVAFCLVLFLIVHAPHFFP